MTLQQAIRILGESVTGTTTHCQAFRDACQLACATMNAELRRQEQEQQP